MTLAAGHRLGPYEITGLLGVGGMGEVYRARDTRLGRDVALKVLPREVAKDPERRARFEREARAISALNHPHVCALHDVGRGEGPDGPLDFLVMELVEGETLARRLQRGPLPLVEALALGVQVAEALGAAHKRGIVHRDLKPGNVVLAKSGAKLLDFGLARQDTDLAGAASGVGSPSAATEPAPLTRRGTVLGTWPYLSPEQLSGRPADARSDLFALGAVLYEAITGLRAFPGGSPSEVAAAILKDEPPDPRGPAPATPPMLVALVRQCLVKDPEGRWQCADDVARGLRLVGDAAGPAILRPEKGRRLAWLITAAGLVVGAVLLGLLLRSGGPPVEPLRFVVPPPPGALLTGPRLVSMLAVSPDGRRIAFAATVGGVPSLWLWSARDGEARRIEGSDWAASPFFSPDGGEVAFFTGDEMRRAPVTGGPASLVTRAPSGTSGTWGRDGTILFTQWLGPEAGLWSVAAPGGAPRKLVPAATSLEMRAFPEFLPDGRRYLFIRGTLVKPVGERQLCVSSLDGGEPACLMPCDSKVFYSPTGHLLFIRRGNLLAQPFDARRLRAEGEPKLVTRDVRWFGPSGTPSFAVSADGRTLVHEPSPGLSQLVWFDRAGRDVGRVGEAGRLGFLQIAPDGRRVVVQVWNADTGGRDLWIYDLASGVRSRVTFDPRDVNAAVWSPDGRRLAYAKAVEGPPDVAVRSLDPPGPEQVLLRAPGVQLPLHWSPDGRQIAYSDYSVGRRVQRQIWLLSLDGQPSRFLETPASTYDARFSPDGRSLAYVSEETGRPEVYVAPVEGRGPSRRLSRAGGLMPRWRRDGRELYFFQPDGMMMAAATGPDAPAPAVLFHVEGVAASDFDYDVTADGQRFLVRLAPQPEGSAGLRVALEWARHLGRLEAAGEGR